MSYRFGLYRFNVTVCSACLLMALSYTPVHAQAQAPTAPPQAVNPKPCSDPAVEGQRNRDTTSGQSLSEKLDNSNGVLCPPPEVDPSIKAPTPDAGKMPVIPPPGSPGGDPTVQPK